MDEIIEKTPVNLTIELKNVLLKKSPFGIEVLDIKYRHIFSFEKSDVSDIKIEII